MLRDKGEKIYVNPHLFNEFYSLGEQEGFNVAGTPIIRTELMPDDVKWMMFKDGNIIAMQKGDKIYTKKTTPYTTKRTSEEDGDLEEADTEDGDRW